MSETICATGESRRITSPAAMGGWRARVTLVAVFLGLFTLGLIEWVTWGRLERREAELARPGPVGSQLGLQVIEHLHRINGTLFRFQLSDAEAEREGFRSEVRALGELLAQASVLLSTPRERELVMQLQSALQVYVADTSELLERGVRGIRRYTPGQLHEQLKGKVEPMRILAGQLAKVQADTLANAFAAVRAELAILRIGRQIGLVILLVLVGVLAWWLHRVYVAPLRVALDQTQAVVQRQEKLASLGALAAGVAHEIRNPLMAIKFRLFSLKQALGPGLATNEDFQIVHGEIDRLDKIVKNFLQFARPPEPRLTSINARDLLHELEQLLRPEMASRQITLVTEAPEPVSFPADREQLQQVLINLIQNAADSLAGPGKITLRARHGATKLLHRQEPVVVLEVADTGRGIAPEAESRLFDPFFSTKEGGTGLGLAIAARIIDRHSGLIQYSTQAGRGTTFSLLLPKETRPS